MLIELPRICAVVLPVDAPADPPPVDLGGPAIGHRNLDAAIVARLHAAGATCLQRLARRVEPDIGARCQRTRDLLGVVLHEGNAGRYAGLSLDTLQECL